MFTQNAKEEQKDKDGEKDKDGKKDEKKEHKEKGGENAGEVKECKEHEVNSPQLEADEPKAAEPPHSSSSASTGRKKIYSDTPWNLDDDEDEELADYDVDSLPSDGEDEVSNTDGDNCSTSSSPSAPPSSLAAKKSGGEKFLNQTI